MTTKPFVTTNQSQCPICNASNHCAVTKGKDGFNCWCQQTPIAPELIAKANQTGKDKSCICQRCAEQAQKLARPL